MEFVIGVFVWTTFVDSFLSENQDPEMIDNVHVVSDNLDTYRTGRVFTMFVAMLKLLSLCHLFHLSFA